MIIKTEIEPLSSSKVEFPLNPLRLIKRWKNSRKVHKILDPYEELQQLVAETVAINWMIEKAQELRANGDPTAIVVRTTFFPRYRLLSKLQIIQQKNPYRSSSNGVGIEPIGKNKLDLYSTQENGWTHLDRIENIESMNEQLQKAFLTPIPYADYRYRYGEGHNDFEFIYPIPS